jgi:aspartyl protease family protein
MSAELPPTFKVVTVWLLAGLVLFLGVQWWQHRAQQARFSTAGDIIEIRRGPDGHYHWPGAIEGREVDFLVDTGATRTALPEPLARAAGLVFEGQVQSATAGGVVTGWVGRGDLQLQGGVQVERLPITVLPALGAPLLGMDVLGRLPFSQADGVLRLRPPGP